MTRNPVSDNESFSAVYWSALTNAHAYEYVRSGCAPSKGTGSWDVDVAAGEIVSGGSGAAVTAGTVTLTAADADNPRVDLVTASATGTLTATAGTPAANPSAPDIPSGHVLIAAAFLPAGAGSITAGDIHDYRVLGAPSAHPFERADLGFNASPAGLVAMWSGSIASIPSGWVLCDGLNGTPNLQNRFVVGAGGTYAVDATGGESAHTLTAAELASHRHTARTGSGIGSNEWFDSGAFSSSGSLDTARSNPIGFTGGDSAHENKPPYYALAYIMKT